MVWGKMDDLMAGLDPTPENLNKMKSFLGQLARDYDNIYTSPQNGLANVFRRKDLGTPAGVARK